MHYSVYQVNSSTAGMRHLSLTSGKKQYIVKRTHESTLNTRDKGMVRAGIYF